MNIIIINLIISMSLAEIIFKLNLPKWHAQPGKMVYETGP